MTTIPRFDLLNSALQDRNLLEASAGTGKTFTIAALYLRLLLETPLTVDRILVVTFTEAATEELRDRIRQRIKDTHDALCGAASDDPFLQQLLARMQSPEEQQLARAKVREALICFDEAAIYTIHGFCQRILQDKAFEAGALFDTELITNQAHLLNEIAQDYWRQQCASQTGPFASLLCERKLTPSSFTENLNRITSDPGIKVIPENPAADLGELEAEWQKQRETLQQSWQTHQAEIRILLRDAEGLNRSKYNRDSLEKWCADIDSYFSSTAAFQAPEKLFERFTSEALKDGSKKNAEPPQHPFFDLCQSCTATYAALNAAYALKLIDLHAGFIRYLRQELPARKKALNIRHFDDLLLDVRDRLTSSVGPLLCDAIRIQFRAAFIDEFQDTDPIQFAIFQTLYPDSSCPVFFIGDPKQAIYSFRGADIFAYIAATRVVEHRYTLATNWRSTPALVEAINTVFHAHKRPFVFEEISFQPVDPKPDSGDDVLLIAGAADTSPLQFWSYQPLDAGKEDNVDVSRQRLAQAVCSEIAQLLNLSGKGQATIKNRPLEAGDIAVLVRTHKEGSLIEATLKRRGIPSVQSGTGSLFDSREAREMLRVLRAIADPVNESLLKAALATDLFGLSGDQLGQLCHSERELEVWLDKLLDYNRTWQGKGLIVMTGKLLAEETVRQRLLSLPDGQRRLTNLLHCCELLHKAALEQHLGIDGLLKWFSRQFEEERGQEEYQIRLESDDNAVKIVTIHKSKGLEYPIVFCPFCWNSAKGKQSVPLLFHQPDAQSSRTLDLGSENLELHKTLAERESLAEQMRLLYVAMTRAKYRCYVGWGQLKGAETSSLGYLLQAPEQPAAETEQAELALRYPSRLDHGAITSALERLAVLTSGILQVEDLPWQGTAVSIDALATDRERLAPLDFKGTIDRSWCVSSFSNLTSGIQHPQAFHEPEKADLTTDAEIEEAEIVKDDFADFMSFPKGATAGNCLHLLFETIDFAGSPEATLEQAARAALAAFNFDLRWLPAVLTMVNRTLRTPLATPTGEHFTLNQLASEECLAEMHFFLPLVGIDTESLARVFAEHAIDTEQIAGFAGQLKDLGFSRHHGMLQGFIDLVFRHDGRYYLLDWKSNHLGSSPDAYRQEPLTTAMQKSYYTLQYHLYLAALHRHLRNTLTDYCYEQHFGGVVYAYLRGTALNDGSGSTLGIYRDRPQQALVEALADYLTKGEEAA